MHMVMVSPPVLKNKLYSYFVGKDKDSALSDIVSIWLPQRTWCLLRTILSQNTKKAKKAVIRVKASIQVAAMKKFSVD